MNELDSLILGYLVNGGLVVAVIGIIWKGGALVGSLTRSMDSIISNLRDLARDMENLSERVNDQGERIARIEGSHSNPVESGTRR